MVRIRYYPGGSKTLPRVLLGQLLGSCAMNFAEAELILDLYVLLAEIEA